MLTANAHVIHHCDSYEQYWNNEALSCKTLGALQ